MTRAFRNRLTWLIMALTLLWGVNTNAGIAQGVAPDFTLKSNSNANVKLSEHRGDVVMINFWASWCGPCRQEMPLLEQINDRYKDLGFTLIGVNVDENPAKAQEILRDIPVNFPILYDSANKVSKLYNVNAMPSTFLVDRNGNLRYFHKGYRPGYEKEYEQQIKTLIKE